MLLRPLFLAALSATIAVAADSRLTNLSVRSAAGAGSETLIVGLSISGTGSKNLLLRGVGPALTPFGVTGAVSDPQLALFSGPTQIDQNDNWGGGTALADSFVAAGAFALPPASRDAALLKALQPGSYYAQLVAASGPGIALVECYDLDSATSTASFSNVSARSVAGSGANVLTVGFAIAGRDPKPVLIRGVGPTLGTFGVTGTLPAARLRLFDSAGNEIGNSTNWTTGVTPTSLFTSVGAFALPVASNDGVLFLALPAGAYTAQVSGAGSATGTALVEVYGVDNSPVSFVTLQPVSGTSLGAPFDPGAGTASPGPDVNPAIRTQARPTYPFELRRASITGQALIDFFVKSDGTVGNAVAIRATDAQFATAAIAAVRTWTFSPGRKNGQLATVHFQVPIVFSLDD
ncbi:MAG: TonB family protein [Verrucomicrobia bacterium]|nr:TonB family protein [Verrucomicrobiota bacterium]